MKYFIEDTTLTDIADAVREKEESTQRIPVVELAERIRDIQSGAQLAVTLNADGTQNLIIKDDGSVIEIPDPNPVLLWTNASPTSNYDAQTVPLTPGYSAYFVECRFMYNNPTTGVTYVPVGETRYACVPGTSTAADGVAKRSANAQTSGIVFGKGENNSAQASTSFAIPTRIWGVKFTL